jgi:hypothetical protein
LLTDPALPTRCDREGLAIFEPERAKLVEPGFANLEQSASQRRVDGAGVEIGDGLTDELNGKTVKDLALFISRRWQKNGLREKSATRQRRFKSGKSPPGCLAHAWWRGRCVGLRYAPASFAATPPRESTLISPSNTLFHFCSVSVHF